MEVEAARRLWSRYEARHQLWYTGFLSDGDSKAHKAVTELELYPVDYNLCCFYMCLFIVIYHFTLILYCYTAVL